MNRKKKSNYPIFAGRTPRLRAQAAPIGNAQSAPIDGTQAVHTGSAHWQCTQAARTQVADMGSALNHKLRKHEIGAGPGLTNQIGQEGLSWAEQHGRVKTHGLTPTVVTVGRVASSWG